MTEYEINRELQNTSYDGASTLTLAAERAEIEYREATIAAMIGSLANAELEDVE